MFIDGADDLVARIGRKEFFDEQDVENRIKLSCDDVGDRYAAVGQAEHDWRLLLEKRQMLRQLFAGFDSILE